MTNSERRQFSLFEASVKPISPDQLDLVCSALKQAPLGAVVYFNGVKGMDLCSLQLQELFEEKDQGSDIRVIHYQQLLFHGQGFWQRPSPHHLDSPLMVVPTELCVTIVEEFNEYDESRINQVIGRIEQAPSLIKWVLFVPVWKRTVLSSILEEWILAKSLPRFYLETER